MGTLVLRLLVSLCFLQFCLSADVLQNPKLLLVHPKVQTSMTCSHDKSNYDYKYWYYMEKGKGLVLIGYHFKKDQPDYEKTFTGRGITIEPDGDRKSNLKISEVSSDNSGVYYCASSIGTASSTQYFGEGTILFVLEPGKKILYPKVKIYLPNKQEFHSEQKLISLVCVANGFYPEHVRLEWFVNGILKTSTYENVPQESDDKQTFYTSKRLSLTRLEYFNPGNTFKCVAGFIGDYSGNKTSDEIQGEADCSISKEEYGMYIYQGKISYIMVLCKSAMYGIIVLFIIWRRKAIATSS